MNTELEKLLRDVQDDCMELFETNKCLGLALGALEVVNSRIDEDSLVTIDEMPSPPASEREEEHEPEEDGYSAGDLVKDVLERLEEEDRRATTHATSRAAQAR